MTWTLPQKTDWMTKQMAHEPTRQYAEEIYSVIKTHPYKKALEIGNAWGVSTTAILLAGTGKLTSVDANEPARASEEVLANKVADRVHFIQQLSEDFWKQNQETFDLVYVDGSHLYKDVRNDLFEGWGCLESGGLLMIDDFTHKKNLELDEGQTMYGVSLACWELVQAKQIKYIRTKPNHILYMRKP